MADDTPLGYREIPEEDRRKAQVFFERAQTVAGTGNFDYAIEMYVSGLAIDPDAVDAHQSLRDISMKRKASGGKPVGMWDGMKLKKPTKDDKQNMLNAEKLLAFDPGNTDHMQLVLQNAHRAGAYDTCVWMADILMKANADTKNPDFSKFIVTKDIMASLAMLTRNPDLWKKAANACHYAAMMRPEDMDLQTELKNLGAQETMSKGNYGQAKSFRDSVKNLKSQEKLMVEDKDVRTEDQMIRLVNDAEQEWKADPNDPGKFRRYIETLEKTEQPEFENRAVEALQDVYQRTKQFSFRHRIGQIMIKQWGREERNKRAAIQQNPLDENAKTDYSDFKRKQNEFELEEFRLWAENYPTEMRYKFEIGRRLFSLDRFDEAIPVLQEARRDPKFKADATIDLAKSFLAASFVDEASETLEALINEYQLKGDARSKEMYYWRGRALEQKRIIDQAVKLYSQVAQWDFNYRDVQARIKRLRSEGGGAGSAAAG